MKIVLRLLLLSGLLVVVIYSTTPVWLPHLVSTQLPQGWHLEDMKSGYPGFSAIPIKSLSVTTRLPLAGLTITAEDIGFTYRNLKTEIASVTLGVELQTGESDGSGRFTVNDLVLPVIDLRAQLPDLSIQELHVTLQHGLGAAVENPLRLDLQSLKLTPLADNGFNFSADMRLEGAADVAGQAEVEVTANSLAAALRFPAGPDIEPWLTLSLNQVSLNQTGSGLDVTTRIETDFNADAPGREYFDAILARNSAGNLALMAGKLQVQADFSGRQQQTIERIALATQKLQAEFNGGTTTLDLMLLATPAGEDVEVILTEAAQIQYRDSTGKLDDLLMQWLPALNLSPQPATDVLAWLNRDSRFSIQPGADPLISFVGDVRLEMNSDKRSVSVNAPGLDFELANLAAPYSVLAKGLADVRWEESMPLGHTTPQQDLRADALTVSSSGSYRISDQGIDFKQAGHVEIRHPSLRQKNDDQSSSMYMGADKISADFEISSRNDQWVSAGNALVTLGRIDSPATTADNIKIGWQNFNLDTLVGELTTRSSGFATEFDAQTWTGFDFDSRYKLLENANVEGSATLLIDDGPDLPLKFEGNIDTSRWDISLPPTTIKAAQLKTILRTGHLEWPAPVKLTGGAVEMQGQLLLGETIRADLKTRAYGMGATILKNVSRDMGFDFDIHYADSVSASGPVSIGSFTLAGGVDVSRVGAELSLENAATLSLQNLKAEVFEGSLQSRILQFSADGIEDTKVEMSDINLARLLAFIDVGGLQGTGRVDASIPLGSDQAGIHIRGGTFQSSGPGRLAFSKEGFAASNIGLLALENFHYQSLSGTLDYQSAGAYQIGVRLEGKNPDLYDGHAIIFRLNINGILPELFEALFMTGDFEDSILKEITTQQKQ